MILYWVLLLITAFIAYIMGSLDTMVLASNFVFRRSLRRLGKGNVWISNFRRVFGIGGFIKLLLVEVVKDLLPILIGGWLLGIKDHALAGRAFAGFCVVLGRLYPVFYRFKGSHASICLIITALSVEFSVGVATALFVIGASFVSRYLSMGAIIGSFAFILVPVLVLDDNLVILLCVFTSVLILFKHIPAIARILNGREEKLSFEEDISYKFDQKF